MRILSIDTVLLGLQFESLKLEQAYWFNLGTIIVYLVRQVMNINLDKIVYYNYPIMYIGFRGGIPDQLMQSCNHAAKIYIAQVPPPDEAVRQFKQNG